jgi:hypothetical protein
MPAGLLRPRSNPSPTTPALRARHPYSAPGRHRTARLRRHPSALQAGVIRSHLGRRCPLVPVNVISIRRQVVILEEKATLNLAAAHQVRTTPTHKRPPYPRPLLWVHLAAHTRTYNKGTRPPIRLRRPQPRLSSSSSTVPPLAVLYRPTILRHRILSSVGLSRSPPPHSDHLRANRRAPRALLNQQVRTNNACRRREADILLI